MTHVIDRTTTSAPQAGIVATLAIIHLRLGLTHTGKVLDCLGHASLGLALVVEADREVIFADVVLIANLR